MTQLETAAVRRSRLRGCDQLDFVLAAPSVHLVAVAAPGVFVADKVYVFARSNQTWNLEASITTDFHCCVGLSNDLLAVATFAASPRIFEVYRRFP